MQSTFIKVQIFFEDDPNFQCFCSMSSNLIWYCATYKNVTWGNCNFFGDVWS